MVKHVRWLAVLSALSVATPSWAQVQTGTILVKAVDDQGAVVPGAAVSISSAILPREITGTTDAGGVYQVPGLSAGRYIVTS